MYASRFQHTNECVKQREAYMRLPKHFFIKAIHRGLKSNPSELIKQSIGAYKALRQGLKALHQV